LTLFGISGRLTVVSALDLPQPIPPAPTLKQSPAASSLKVPTAPILRQWGPLYNLARTLGKRRLGTGAASADGGDDGRSIGGTASLASIAWGTGTRAASADGNSNGEETVIERRGRHVVMQ
jgi:hypothetical protein